MKYKYLVLSSAIFGVLSLTGCGGGSGTTATDAGVDDEPITTAFSVNVQVPDGLNTTEVASAPASFFDDFFISTAAAATVSDQLGAGNFKVAIVDAAGVVQDIVIPESISQEPDGSWIVVLAGGTRVDCVIIADISKTPEVTIGQTLPADAIYAPTASEQFDIDIRSTAAFQEFIEAVEDSLDLTAGSGFTEEQVAALVEAAQQLPLPAYSITQTFEQYVATAIRELEAAIEREVIVVSNTDTTFNLANYFEGGGVLNWIYGEGGQFYERGQFSYDSTAQTISDLEQEYNFDTKVWDEYVVSPYTDALILTATGWVANVDLDDLDSFNADGSFTLKDKAVAEDKEDISAVKVDVSGQQINLFATGFKAALANAAVFSAGAEAFLISSSTTLDTYKIWANEFNGTVNVWEKFNNTGAVITTLDEIFSATASTETDPTLINTVSIYASNAEYQLEFFGTGTTATVNVLSIDYGASPPVSSVIETTTWERKTVNGKDMVLVDAANSSIAEEGLVFYMLTVYNNQLAEGEFIPAGTVSEDGSEYLFNDIAAADINNNFDPDRLACGFSSPWDSLANQPATFNSYNDFLEVLADCGGAQAVAAVDIEGSTLTQTYEANGATIVETVTYGTGGAFSFSITAGGTELGAATGNWTIVNNLLTITNPNSEFFSVNAIIGNNHQLSYGEEAAWTNIPDASISDPAAVEGKISHNFFVLAETPPPTASLDCSYSSGWDDTLDQPATFNSYTDFEAVLTDCGSLVQAITDADITGTWVDSFTEADGSTWVETLVFNANGTFDYTETKDTTQVDSVSGNWSVSNNLLTLTVGSLYKEVGAFLTDGTQKFYDEATDWTPPSDLALDGNADGEIWTGHFVKQ